MLLATPTFLQMYLRGCQPGQFGGLNLVVVGAEKLPVNLAAQFEEKLGKEVMEGYGLTETSPVSNVNLPDLKPDGSMIALPSRRIGSVGQLLNGIAVKVTDPVTERPLPIDESGLFGPVERATFSFAQRLDREGLRELVLSRRYR